MPNEETKTLNSLLLANQANVIATPPEASKHKPVKLAKRDEKLEEGSMSFEQLRVIQTELGLNHQEMADMLGCSLVSYKRFPVGARPIPTYIARFCIALQLIEKNDLTSAFVRKAKKFR